MLKAFRLAGVLAVALLRSSALTAQTDKHPLLPPIPDSVTFAPERPSLPTIFVAGDSTATIWGPQFVQLFNPSKVNVVLAGASGRSSRTYLTQGIWARVLAKVRPHDIVLIQFGRNDPSNINDNSRARGSLPGIDDDTKNIDNLMTGQPEVVHTFGWYVRQMVRETQAKGATPIVLSMTPRNRWADGHIVHGDADYGLWGAQIAQQEHCDFVDVNSIMIMGYEKMGEAQTNELFSKDGIHTTGLPAAKVNAAWILQGLEGLPDAPVTGFVSAGAKGLKPVAIQ